ncbi:DUF262 domain-containing HNH endonuclease family protein [Bradyrhizobium sp. LHD-71]|uniref:DUF262 domain-containing protein n=1 Tax=Bradyrhizobium sp. LHD-71 TaxID=3072141 RepID=UPI00280C4BEC|nr:DUF262 domain-containing HNH endonuclease family protein [Bradyrhizobium sp. LHD-71]MDQ8732441.1 DUF262 domain-containing HNH endonuclease family protein [Bradyrhizobium sp. LHD-71]
MTSIEAHERTIGQLFSDSFSFEIPSYQRPYAWEKEQADELLTDLIYAMENSKTSGGMCFLGSIVLIKQPSAPLSKVVDGQQRLTTLTILLSVLRDLTENDEARLSRRNYVFQRANPDNGTEERYRLTLRPKDQPFFSNHIQLPDATNKLPDPSTLTGSHARIIENARHFRTTLSTIPEDRRNALIAFIIQHCFVVAVAVPTPEAARRIFTVLNARGLDLTPTDILKADLLERGAPSQEISLADRWEAVEQRIGRDKMVELFGHIRMMFERDKPRISLEKGFKEFVLPFNEDAERFISNILEPISDAIALLSSNQSVKQRYGVKAATALRSLERIDNKDWLAPALLLMWKAGDDAAHVSKVLCDLERVAYFLFTTRADVNARIRRFASVMNEIDMPAGQTISAVGLALSRVEQTEFIKALDGSLYTKTRVCKPVLFRLDERLSTGGASYDEQASIEHVLPQTVSSGSEWANLFPDEAERILWTHRIANLVLLTRRINAKASNWDFEQKKINYFATEDGTSPFVVTQGVLRAETWSPEYLKTRQAYLISTLADIWELDGNDPDRVQIDASSAGFTSAAEEATWREDVRTALVQLGGQAHLEEIYRAVNLLREKGGRSVPASFRSLVRKNLEENSSDSEAFSGLDLFALKIKGSGVWSIKSRDA